MWPKNSTLNFHKVQWFVLKFFVNYTDQKALLLFTFEYLKIREFISLKVDGILCLLIHALWISGKTFCPNSVKVF